MFQHQTFIYSIIIRHLSSLRYKIQERFGRTMARCGMTITITSVTDLFAFGIGGTSSLPILSHFCIYAAIGIFAVYLYMTSFFLAWFSLDERRIDSQRDACVFCIKKSNTWKPYKGCNVSVMERLFTIYGDILSIMPVKILVLVSSVGMFFLSTYGVTQLEADFDSFAFLPNDSYLRKYNDASSQYFPTNGDTGFVYLTDVPNLGMKLDKVKLMLSRVENLKGVSSVNSFLPYFEAFVKIVILFHYCFSLN